MEETPFAYMEIKARKIVRRSIFIFLKYYQYFTTTPVLLMLPFSVFVLIFQAFYPCFSYDLGLCSIFCSVFSLPFTLSSLTMAKGYIIEALNYQNLVLPPSFSKLVSLYRSLFLTQLCNSVIIITAKTVIFSALFIGFNSLELFGVSSKNSLIMFISRSVSYSFLAYTMFICNLALVVTETENCSGYVSVFKACSLLKRVGSSRALLMALPANLGSTGIGALIRCRIVRAYHFSGMQDCVSMALEGLLIAYLYSLLIVLDTILSCLYFKSCNSACQRRSQQTGKFHEQHLEDNQIDHLLVSLHTNE